MGKTFEDRVLVLYSGGLDSRLVIKLLKSQGYDVEAVYFKLPFVNHHDFGSLLTREQVPVTTLDCTKGELLNAYLERIHYPRYSRGAGYNPCIDCKIFMYQQAEHLARERNIPRIATGEVIGQRPLSQRRQAIKLIEKEIQLPVLRPLNDLNIVGRKRQQQMKLAEWYEISYPNPAGGCLLCEKGLKERFKILFKYRLINEYTYHLINTGRHYVFPQNQWWLIIGRDETENTILEQYASVILSGKGKPAVFYYTFSQEVDEEAIAAKALSFQRAYSEKNRSFIDDHQSWKI